MAKVNVRINISYNYTIDVPEEIIKRHLDIKTCEDEYALIDYCEEIDPVFDTISHSIKCADVDYWDARLIEIYDDKTGEVYYED